MNPAGTVVLASMVVLVLGAIAPGGARAESPAAAPTLTDVVRGLQTGYVDGCVNRGSARGEPAASARSFWDCSWVVIADNVTIAELLRLAAGDTGPIERVAPMIKERCLARQPPGG